VLIKKWKEALNEIGEIKKGKFLIEQVVFNLQNGSMKYRANYF
jgi:hypothetical protein